MIYATRLRMQHRCVCVWGSETRTETEIETDLSSLPLPLRDLKKWDLHTHSLSLSHTHKRTHTLFNTHSLANTQTLPSTHTHSPTHTHTHTLSYRSQKERSGQRNREKLFSHAISLAQEPTRARASESHLFCKRALYTYGSFAKENIGLFCEWAPTLTRAGVSFVVSHWHTAWYLFV